MIVLDGDDERDKIDPPFLGHTLRFPVEASLRPVPSLPDYDTSQQEHEISEEPSQKRQRFGSKFWRGALWAFALYVALSLTIAVPLAVTKLKQKPKPWKDVPSFALWSDNDSASKLLPLQSLRDSLSGHEIRCNIWDIAENSSSNPLLLSTAHHKLSAQGLVTIRSNISYDADTFSGINGSLTVEINKDTKESRVVFLVDLLSSDRKLRERTNVCFTDAGPNRGLTIYTPKQLDGEEILSFSVQVLLPAKSTIETFVTYLPLFTQKFGNIGQKVAFDQLIIEGTNNDIACGELSGSQISVKNVLAPIEGSFNVTNSLTLDTIRGAITTNVVLTQSPHTFKPTFLSLDTGYSQIDANVTLSMTTPTDTSFSPSFITQVKTFNGAIAVNISHDRQTPNSALSLQVQNALAQSNVRLDSKFQGTFNVQTKLDYVTIRSASSAPAKKNAPNPAGVRTIGYDQQSPGKAMGWIGLGVRPPPGPRTPGQGHVEIISSLSPIVLDLG